MENITPKQKEIIMQIIKLMSMPLPNDIIIEELYFKDNYIKLGNIPITSVHNISGLKVLTKHKQILDLSKLHPNSLNKLYREIDKVLAQMRQNVY